MPLEEIVAGVALLAVIAYAVFAGADFGGGIWDMFATGPRRNEQRAAIAHAMGPVWEANHVWLIFVLVVLFTAFPPAFAALSIGLFTMFHLVLIGITLRGAAFVFRAYGPKVGRLPGRFGYIFGMTSVITPVLLGMCLGAVSAGGFRVIDGQVTIEGTPPWLAPISLAMGALALAICAYLAAVYLTLETEGKLQADFRVRALIAGTVVVGLSVVTIPLLYLEARHLWEGLISLRAAPVITIGVAAALLSGWALLTRRFRLARLATVAQVIFLLLGWGLAQRPYLIYPDLTLSEAAAPAATLKFVLYSLPFGMGLLLPSLWLLFRVFKGQQPHAVARTESQAAERKSDVARV
jgi:cytochrome d ubiquinol oxidase subunit II